MDNAVKAAESLKEQRAERHLELKSRITGAELRSPGTSSAATPTNSEESPGGGISPVKITTGGVDSGEDMFARVSLCYVFVTAITLHLIFYE